MKKQNYLFSNPSFFDILLPQKVRQVDLYETLDADLILPHTFLRLSQ